MDIVSRLKKFLEQNGISNSQFADTCDIPRPTLSQLLNGRNKKVSDEVIGKIHRAYPSLNIMWLMFGDGEMFVADATHEASQASAADTVDAGVDAMGQRAISFDTSDDDYRPSDAPAKPQQAVQRAMPASPSVSERIQNIVRSSARQSQRGGGTSPHERRVVNMMVFYSDGTFEEFVPMR